ncbi:MFS transporter [Bradyrhizobium sp. U87765 SZCCT0131]|uniref:MFS transporter n=1 Tax=unclassified Bradyrhizobium TaxID=2631580 RepID=UPI001BA47539|nr:MULTISPECIES: MFS transporter [unclassified Bradyrhizobium]MBR1216869.1 MFS transporter [Bradyrhizobium sp. U87765 SZCCT0131]MBR1259375.1 MFS transporter [Bradyrhizobium sp. U87765 SZCCT0134]MBR1305516.1 MFS transporter [Bradyrhizobium sp. U87765 SZCCT0110]MBR1321883.1 MFS transporter [Bradyrhizobium sp. U87765 SZCCT0109]MBR1350839.1 MFS transporter [Bradyrhizobium sp. U87765 SZCCT0048]
MSISSCVPHGSRQQSAFRIWLAVVALGIATFAIVLTEFAPIGLLSQIAQSLGESRAAIGLTVTLYAWIGAASALVCAVLLGRLPIRPLLIVLMLVLAASNALAMLSGSFAALLASRALGAVAHGFFWAMVAAVAGRIAPPDRLGLATSIVFGGITVATVLGVPLANLIGQAEGWPAAFGATAALCVVTALLLSAVLPPVRADAAVGIAALAEVARNRPLRRVYIAAAFTVIAHFGAFTFIEAFLRDMPGVAAPMIAVLLFAFGAAGILGNVLTGIFIDRFMRPAIALGLVVMAVALAVLGRGGAQLDLAALVVLLVAWGMAFAVLMVGLQAAVLRTAGTAAMPASAIYTAVFNTAGGAGAVLGAAVLGEAGLPGLMLSAGGVALLALLVLVSGRRPGA